MDLSKIAVISQKIKETMNVMIFERLRRATTLFKRNKVTDAPATMASVDQPTNQVEQTKFIQPPNLNNQNNVRENISDLNQEVLIEPEPEPDQDENANSLLEDAIIEEEAQFLNKTLEYKEDNHEYQLYIPSNYQRSLQQGINLPLVVMLHGCTQSSEDFAAGTQMNQLAELNNCLVAYPTQPSSANNNHCWNWFRTGDQQRELGEPAWLAELTRTIIDDYSVDALRVYIAGLSAGASMAVIMAETYPDLYAAVGVHSGLGYGSANNLTTAMLAMSIGGSSQLSNDKNSTHYVPMIVFHGDQDSTVSIRNGDQIFTQAMQRLNADQTELQTSQHQLTSVQGTNSTQIQVIDSQGTTQLEYWKIHGAGHSWAGGSTLGSYTDPLGPHASEEMMRFFLSHQQSVVERVH